jgi:pilus assembly protein CpaF
MVLMSELQIPSRVIQQQLAGAIRMVLQVSRLQDGSRKIMSIAEVRGVHDERIDVRDIFIFDRVGTTAGGKVQGRFRWTGEQPRIIERLKTFGIELPAAVFDEVVEVNL